VTDTHNPVHGPGGDVTERPPVTDWLTDFDHQHPDYAAAAPEVWEEVRTSECPIAHSERYGGTWLPTRHDDIGGEGQGGKCARHQSVELARLL